MSKRLFENFNLLNIKLEGKVITVKTDFNKNSCVILYNRYLMWKYFEFEIL